MVRGLAIGLVALMGLMGCVKSSNPSGLLLWLETPSEVNRGEIVPLTLKLKNVSSHPIVLGHASPAYNFIVTRPDGTEVWRWATGTLDVILSTTVNAGEEVEFTAEWDQRELKWDDQNSSIKGDPVSPGTYWVHGIFHGNILEKVYQGGTEYLKSKPKQLVIMPIVGVLPQKDMRTRIRVHPLLNVITFELQVATVCAMETLVVFKIADSEEGGGG